MNKIKLIISFTLGVVVASTILVTLSSLKPEIFTYKNKINFNLSSAKAANNVQIKKKSDIYSTTEKVVGKWINNKPLYQKVVTGRTPSTINTWAEVANLGSTIFIIKYDGNINFDNKQQNVTLDGNMTPVQVILNSTTSSTSKKGAIVMCASNSSYVNVPFVLTVWYTKTTD